jgi:hypothetical protein
MPRKDRTFSSDDVLRIIAKHLTRAEQYEVLRRLGALQDEPLEISPKFEQDKKRRDINHTRELLISLLETAETVLKVLEIAKDPITGVKTIITDTRQALQITEGLEK